MKTKILLAALILALCSVGLVFSGSESLDAGQAQTSSFEADKGHDLKMGETSGQLPLMAAETAGDDDSHEDENDEGHPDDEMMDHGDDDENHSDDEE